MTETEWLQMGALAAGRLAVAGVALAERVVTVWNECS